jgi:hypothetical protein
VKSKKDYGVIVGIVGGIGNQLFQYYAGRFLAEKNKSELTLDFRNHGVAGTKHLGTLRDLDFGTSIDELQVDASVMSEITWRVHQKISSDKPLIGKLSTKYLGLYQSNVVGFDPELNYLHAPIKIRGYFQTWKYIDSLEAKFLKTPMLKNPTDWYRYTLEQIEVAQPIAIHIRRGDYEKHSNTFGVLNRDYYEKALNALDIISLDRKIFVFSDDTEKAKAILSKINRDFTYINPPLDSHPMESLLLMSKSSSLIMANSSYSWWAGKFGDPIRQIFAPSKWFRGLQDPSELIPSNWNRIESSWE